MNRKERRLLEIHDRINYLLSGAQVPLMTVSEMFKEVKELRLEREKLEVQT